MRTLLADLDKTAEASIGQIYVTIIIDYAHYIT